MDRYSYDRRPLYHGTSKDFEKPKLNGLGILWLTHNAVAAAHYAFPHWNKSGNGFVWKVTLKSGAKVLDLADLDNPIIREAFDAVNEGSRYSATGGWTEQDWRNQAEFSFLETYRWLSRFFKSKRVDGLTCRDTLNTMPVKHASVALFRLGAIESIEKQVVTDDGKTKMLIGEIQQAVEDAEKTGL